MDTSRGLKDQVIVITGGCGDIGGATAIKLAELGARVVIFDLLDEQPGHTRTQELGGVEYYQVDQGDPTAVENAIDRVTRKFARLDTVIGNAGIGPGGGFLDLTESDWQQVLRVNLVGCAMLAKVSVKRMLEQQPDSHGIRGKVLFTTSWVGDYPAPGADAYCVSKAGLNHLVRLIAQSYAAQGIRANAVSPGILDAGLTKKAAFQRDAQLRKKFQTYIPVGDFGSAEQVADAFVYLCSTESNYMTGQILTVDGGCSVKMPGYQD